MAGVCLEAERADQFRPRIGGSLHVRDDDGRPSAATHPHTVAAPRRSISVAISSGTPAEAFSHSRPEASSRRKPINMQQSRFSITWRQSEWMSSCGLSLPSNLAVISESSRSRSSTTAWCVMSMP